ncbi:hypothetical protein MAMC_00221 [Methylacidimicrobium cyclopophantes]|uniref:Uncharacterized protein n=1 Tax=Methylacidimicrobium cyclopophantes TaxID=1041766 RepID=A0A5E6M642_9BACT|nr:hypothetical protein [Methylacidimicrobium cyclopophantes]VVM04769.1 hypothetical protein MAMC_00221 [Methylacidimicrobium cyclopophantes]
MQRSFTQHGIGILCAILFVAALSPSASAKTVYYPLKQPIPSAGRKIGQLSPDDYISVTVDGTKRKIAIWSSSPSRPFRRIGILETNRWKKHAARIAAKNGGTGILLVEREELPYVPAWVGRQLGTPRFSEFRYWWVIVGPQER